MGPTLVTLLVALSTEPSCPPSRLTVSNTELTIALCRWAQQPAPQLSPPTHLPLSDILNRPEFSRARKPIRPSQTSVWQRLSDWLSAQFETQGAAVFSETTRFVVLAFALVAFTLLLFAQRRAKPRATAVNSEQANADALTQVPQTASQHLTQAHALLSDHPRLALREGFLALLAALESLGHLPAPELKTADEAVAQLKKQTPSSDSLKRSQHLIHEYTSTFYANQPVSLAHCQQFLAEVAVVATFSLRRR